MKKICLLFIFNLLLVAGTWGQNTPVKWDVFMNGDGPDREIVFKATIGKGYHIYSLTEKNATPTTITFSETKNVSLKGGLVASKAPQKIEDEYLGTLEEYSGIVEFKQTIHIDDLNSFNITGEISFQACNDRGCIPGDESFSLDEKSKVIAQPKKEIKEDAIQAKQEEVVEQPQQEEEIAEQPQEEVMAEQQPQQEDVKENKDVKELIGASVSTPNTTNDLTKKKGWQPVIRAEKLSLWNIFVEGFLAGLIALLTPCVWPMIPMTVSFFLKKKQSRRKAILDAIVYGLSIIILYLGLGLLVTVIFGASTLNQLATSALFNIIFFLLLVVFAASFFGAFEITLPASWSNKLDKKADTATGIFAIFFMAFTLALVSFSCTGPIIGTLLVEAASTGKILSPAIGMGGFAIALAIPFTLFAIFPSLMKQMPKSGGWLNSVKVVLGFLELALSLKFLSVADMAYGWRILDREVFLVLWIVIFALMGFYLLGKIRFAHDSKLEHISVTRLFLAMISLSFAIYMVPGLWGAPCKAISAFAPSLSTQDFIVTSVDNSTNNIENKTFTDYDVALEYSQNYKKPILLDFSGYGCVNCRKMEETVLKEKEIKRLIDNKFIFVSLMVDEKADLDEPITVVENGKKVVLKTIGDKWSFLQRYKFGKNAQPYYVVLDAEGNLLSDFDGYDEDAVKFKVFLEKGLGNYK